MAEFFPSDVFVLSPSPHTENRMSLSQALEKVRVEVGKKRLRINDRFYDFDKLRSGLITTDQFRRCLASLNCSLSESDISLITAAFKGKLPNTVSYGDFSAEVDREEAPAELLSSLRSPPRSVAGDAERLVEKFNAGVVGRVLATGVDVTTFFKDFDKHHFGLITSAQFERCFPFPVEPATMAALKAKYTETNSGLVSYHQWCSQIAELVAQGGGDGGSQCGSRSASQSPTRHARFNNPPADAPVSQLVATIRQQMISSKLRCEDAFFDYDKVRSGTVTSGQFCSAFGRLKFVKFFLTHEHLDTLAKAYGTVDNTGILRVNYVAFLADVMPPGTGVAAKSSANSSEHESTFSTTLPLVPLPADEEREALKVLDKVRKTVETCRIALKPVLHDFDRSIKGVYQTRTCTKSRFQRALSINKLTLTQSELELLCKRYAVAGADGQLSDDINYNAFIADVEPAGDFQLAGRSHTSLLPVGHGSVSATAVPEVLRKIALQVSNRNLRLSEFFADFDPLRGGTVQRDKFASAIAIAGVRLTQLEIDILLQEYASSRVAGHVEVGRFNSDVDRIVQSVGASTVLSGSYSSGSLRKTLGAGSPTSQLSNADVDVLRNSLERVSLHVKHHGLLLPPFFCDYDRHHTGRITKTQFLQTVSRHKLPLSEAEGQLLCRAYRDPSDQDFVLYRSFIGDVDDAENVSLQLSIRNSSRKPLQSPRSSDSRPQPSNALTEATLAKVAAFVLRKNVRLEEFFQDADALRRRCIPSSRFRGALGIIGLVLDDNELRSLETAYHTDRILDGVDYLEFSNEIHRRTSGDRRQADQQKCNTTAAGDAEYGAVINKLKQAFGARRLSVRPAIQDFDKLRKGTVTETQFLSCLTASGVRLDNKDILVLRRQLTAGEGLFSYHAFCDAVDTIK